jgi:superfamily II DNA/RNA helicase
MIEAFKSIVGQRGWDSTRAAIMERIEERLSRRLLPGQAFSLTAFQEKAISDPRFFQDQERDADVRHLMVQGATSAGKTLLSELNILDTVRPNQRSAIVLVPLKAMVHERTEQFRQDMGEHFNVYGSSSDHMEYDELIISGDYDVAVIVYEKFFSMLSQGSAKIMEKCKLLVVDELSMLSREQRGPKLEMALEVVRGNYPDTRIMCLATCDCSTAKICEWLGIPEPIISSARPVALEEHIVEWDGKGVFRMIPANHDSFSEEATPEQQTETIEIPGYRRDWHPKEKKKNLLLTLLDRIYTQTPDAKLLVFTGSKSDAASVAHYLLGHAPARFPTVATESHPDYGEFLKKVNRCDRDEEQADLITTLLPHGIAYHHAGITSALRELIEEEFQDPQSPLKVIVATETLTVGVNLPFDAIIMMDSKVPRGIGSLVPLTMQEYRNFIGRAGRLGQSNRSGQSYLMVENAADRDMYWNSYCNREEVDSALTQAGEHELAPYYLSLLTNRVGLGKLDGTSFTTEHIQRLYDSGLSRLCGTRKKPFSPKKLYDNLYYGWLASEQTAANAATQFGRQPAKPIEPVGDYALEPFGKHMAPYAFSIDTCVRIHGSFYEGYKHHELPRGISQEDLIRDRYLLDILYRVCGHSEIRNASFLAYPKDDRNPEKLYKAKHLVRKQTHLLIESDDYEYHCDLWSRDENNPLWRLLNESSLPDEDVMLECAMRAILLYYWTRGLTVPEIKKLTEFNEFTKIIEGDIERLAEVASFHLDAIYKCLSSATDVCPDADAVTAWRTLHARVKYGMPLELVKLANKHVHGLSRSKLLGLRKEAIARGWTPTQFLYMTTPAQIQDYMTPHQQAYLMEALERRNKVNQFDTLMEMLANETGSALTSADKECLEAVAYWDGKDTALYRKLRAVLKSDAFKGLRISTDGESYCIMLESNDIQITVGILTQGYTSETARNIRDFFDENGTCPHILLVPEAFEDRQIQEALRYFHCNAVMTNMFLALVLANTVMAELGNAHTLTEFLADARGIFTKADHRYFSPSHYVKQASESQTPTFRIICGNRSDAFSRGVLKIEELKSAFSRTEDLCRYEILPWGSALKNETAFCDCPTIILLERSHITRSNSLGEFICSMRHQNFENCLLLLDSPTAENAWNDPNQQEGSPYLAWSGQYNAITKHVASDVDDAVGRIRRFVAEWRAPDYLIGISYAHYDSEHRDASAEWKSDDELIEMLAGELRAVYGEHRILFDQFKPANELFEKSKARDKSLAAYKQCRFFLILWNYWTQVNGNCSLEREAIQERLRDADTDYRYLQTGHPNDPRAPEGEFPLPLRFASDIPHIVDIVKRQMESLLH